MRYIIIALAFFINCCQVGSQYQKPFSQVPKTWKALQPQVPAPQVCNWWYVFDDQILNNLIEQAIAQNPTLAAASFRVQEARDFEKINYARLFPEINFSPSVSNLPLRVHTFGNAPNPPPVLIKDHIDKYSLPLTLLYEFDFWGKYKNQYKAAHFRTEANEKAYQTALLFLTTDLTNAYFQLRIQDAEIETIRMKLATRQKALDIQLARFETHLMNYLDVSFYQKELFLIEADLFEAQNKRALFENQIAILMGLYPCSFKLPSLPLAKLPPPVPASLPSQVLLRRPDIAEQERVMASLHAEINAAYASFFPSIDLVGALSFVSNNFMKTLKNTWAIGSNLLQILFDAGETKANVKLMQARFEEATASYREKTLQAFQEVEDSLSSLKWIENEIQASQNATLAMKVAHGIALDQFRVGLASYLPAANNEQKVLDEELFYLQLLSRHYLYTIHLIKAIGGGW